ncbi:HD domain-containing protein [Maribacter sp. 4G9]|uniref:HD domain-containing protein n=1 Tax=Maribacter sp. 4G9 TaxID=1889777 RepID=UPI000C1573CD|nr:HD domain-containing protein [Maribacter sp. 4G9]PIB27567.1 hypothetical protein BFP75_07130 [Maribacter sp. 4G9]
MLREEDEKIWKIARPHLDVRNNDEHTVVSYHLAKNLLEKYPEANPDVVLTAILLHDTGWKSVPQDKLMESFGYKKKYPELLIQHEKEGAKLAQRELAKLGYDQAVIDQIADIIDGHDSTLEAKNINDAIVKDADKLWRFTPHANKIVCKWYDVEPMKVIDIIMGNSIMHLLLPESKVMAHGFMDFIRAHEALPKYINYETNTIE